MGILKLSPLTILVVVLAFLNATVNSSSCEFQKLRSVEEYAARNYPISEARKRALKTIDRYMLTTACVEGSLDVIQYICEKRALHQKVDDQILINVLKQGGDKAEMGASVLLVKGNCKFGTGKWEALGHAIANGYETLVWYAFDTEKSVPANACDSSFLLAAFNKNHHAILIFLVNRGWKIPLDAWRIMVTAKDGLYLQRTVDNGIMPCEDASRKVMYAHQAGFNYGKENQLAYLLQNCGQYDDDWFKQKLDELFMMAIDQSNITCTKMFLDHGKARLTEKALQSIVYERDPNVIKLVLTHPSCPKTLLDRVPTEYFEFPEHKLAIFSIRDKEFRRALIDKLISEDCPAKESLCIAFQNIELILRTAILNDNEQVLRYVLGKMIRGDAVMHDPAAKNNVFEVFFKRARLSKNADIMATGLIAYCHQICRTYALNHTDPVLIKWMWKWLHQTRLVLGKTSPEITQLLMTYVKLLIVLEGAARMNLTIPPEVSQLLLKEGIKVADNSAQ